MARTPESSTERFPLDCRICTLVTVPFRKISNEITARGENVSERSIVNCCQLLLTRLVTAVTYQEKRPAKSLPPGPPNCMPALVAAPAPITTCASGSGGEPACPEGRAFHAGGE